MTHNSCKISYCHSCIRNINWRCPICRTGTENHYTKLDEQIMKLGKLTVQCNDCTMQMQRVDFEQHKKSCTTVCPRNCGSHVPRLLREAHALTCSNEPVPCRSIELGCTAVVPRSQLQDHMLLCRYEQARWIIEPLKRESTGHQQNAERLKSEVAALKLKCTRLETTLNSRSSTVATSNQQVARPVVQMRLTNTSKPIIQFSVFCWCC